MSLTFPQWIGATVAAAVFLFPVIWWEVEQDDDVDDLQIEMVASKKDAECWRCIQQCEQQCTITRTDICPCWEICKGYCD